MVLDLLEPCDCGAQFPADGTDPGLRPISPQLTLQASSFVLFSDSDEVDTSGGESDSGLDIGKPVAFVDTPPAASSTAAPSDTSFEPLSAAESEMQVDSDLSQSMDTLW